MKRYPFLLFFFGLLLIPPRVSYGFDYSGQWLGTISESDNGCKNLVKAKPGEYKLSISHKNNDIIIMENTVQRPYSGTFNPGRPHFAHVLGAYVINGGYLTELIDIEFESTTIGKGKSIWRWSNGYYSCGGKFAFTLKKLQP